jgi:hypothetical protein
LLLGRCHSFRRGIVRTSCRAVVACGSHKGLALGRSLFEERVVLDQIARAKRRLALAVTDAHHGSDVLCDSEGKGIEDIVVLVVANIDEKYVRIWSNAGRVLQINLRFALIPWGDSLYAGAWDQNRADGGSLAKISLKITDALGQIHIRLANDS